MELIFTNIISFLVGLFGNWVWEKRIPLLLWISEKKHERTSPFSYNPREDGLYVINRWSPTRLLTRDTLKTLISPDQPKNEWFEKELWENEVAEQSREFAGDICYLTDYSIDHRESHLGEKFSMTITPCGYAEHMATCELLRRNPQIHERIRTLIEHDPKEYAQRASPSSIAINIFVLSNNNRFLAIKRSTSVDTAKGVWTVGPNETMMMPRHLTPGSREDIFSLAERCLREEVGLEPQHYREIVFSWIGIYLPLVRGHIVAHVKLTITEEEALNVAFSSFSIFEADRFEWVSFDKQDVSDYISSREGPLSKKNWLDQSALTFQEAWRMREVLEIV